MLVRPARPPGTVLAALRFGVGLLVALYLVGLLAALISIGLWSSLGGWPALLRELLLLLFAPLLPILVVALALRAAVSVLGLLGPLLLLLWLIGPQLLPGVPATASGPQLRVLSWNTGGAQRLADPDSIIQAVQTSAADVVCLVEARSDTLAVVGGSLLSEYPYQLGRGEIVVLSRFPLTDARRTVVTTGAKDSVQVTLEIDHRLIGLTVLHLQRPDAMPGLRSGPQTLMQSGRQFSTSARDTAIPQLVQHLRGEGGPQIVAGDFNMTPTSAAYSALRAELHDAFAAGGWGLGHTYPVPPHSAGYGVVLPLLRIDYVFHSDELVTLEARVGPLGASDHLPVLAEFAFR